MSHLTADWLPDDAPWDKLTWFTKDDLRKQCAKRSLHVAGTKSVLRQRLLDYQRTHTTEVRLCPLRLRFPSPDETEYGSSTKPALPIVLVEDLSTFRVSFNMRFTFASHQVKYPGGNIKKFAEIQVDFTNEPYCSCWGHFLDDLPCLHVEYILRKVFNCPEPLLWQEAFLTSELEHIYKKSHAALSRVKPDHYRQGKRCFICFAAHKLYERNVPCTLCGMPTHPFCLKALEKKRYFDPAQAGQCILCLDKTAWAVEKYFGPCQASPAVSAPGPVTGAIQSKAVSPDSIERTTTLQEPKSAAQERCTSTPLPGVPALIWQEMQHQAQEQQEQQHEQRQKQQKQQAQVKIQAIRPVITEVRVSELPDPARVKVGSRAAAKQTPIAKKLVSKELAGSFGPAAAAVGNGPKSPSPPPTPDVASEAAETQAASSAAAGSGVSGNVHSPNQASLPAKSTVTQADESAVNPPGDSTSRGRSTDAAEEVAELANEQANNAGVSVSALADDNTTIAATLDNTNNNSNNNSNNNLNNHNNSNNNSTDRKAAKLERNLKRLEAKLEHLERDADYYYTKAEKKSRKIERVEKRIRKIKEKVNKRALARRREGIEEGTE